MIKRYAYALSSFYIQTRGAQGHDVMCFAVGTEDPILHFCWFPKFHLIKYCLVTTYQ